MTELSENMKRHLLSLHYLKFGNPAAYRIYLPLIERLQRESQEWIKHLNETETPIKSDQDESITRKHLSMTEIEHAQQQLQWAINAGRFCMEHLCAGGIDRTAYETVLNDSYTQEQYWRNVHYALVRDANIKAAGKEEEWHNLLKKLTNAKATDLYQVQQEIYDFQDRYAPEIVY